MLLLFELRAVNPSTLIVDVKSNVKYMGFACGCTPCTPIHGPAPTTDCRLADALTDASNGDIDCASYHAGKDSERRMRVRSGLGRRMGLNKCRQMGWRLPVDHAVRCSSTAHHA